LRVLARLQVETDSPFDLLLDPAFPLATPASGNA
jgi:hypothetical protein